jgi:AraC family transcriptional regulator of adaptative response / DNA-3-methyladenine glycosylase II
LRLIDEGILDNASVDELAGMLGLGSRHLRRLFLQHVGASPISFAQTRRLQFAKRLLDETNLPITEIALAAGFGSLRRFNSTFRQTYGRAPRELRKNHGSDIAAEAGGQVILKLAFRPPYDWDQVRDFLAAHAIPGVEKVDEHGYSRALRVDNGAAIICVRPLAGESALELRVRDAEPAALFQISSAARRVFDTSADPARTMLAFRSDPLLGPLVTLRPGVRIPGAWDPFECAVCAIVDQRGSSEFARILISRVVQRAGPVIKNTATEFTSLFPSATDLARADLSGLGIAKREVLALQGLTAAVMQGDVDFGASTERVLASLSKVRGIGPSTAEYIALRALGEPDAFPAGDPDLRELAGLQNRSLSVLELQARAESWRPWRGYAAFQLWSAAANRNEPAIDPIEVKALPRSASRSGYRVNTTSR